MSKPGLIRVSRQQLYTLLWQNAAYKVAAAHGISYPSLLQICTQHQIPRPPRAYWIMVAKGRFVDRPPLLQVGNDADQLIEIVPDEKLEPTTPVRPLKSEPLPVLLKPAQIVVPDALFSPLPLVKRTTFCLRAGTPGDDGIIRLNNHKGCLDVAVSRRQIGRTMRFLDTLFKAALSRGMTVRTEINNGKESTLLTVGTAEIQFRLWEMCNGLGNKRRARGDFFLTLDGRGASHRDWNDGDGKPLENQIGKILDAAGRMAERMRLWEREWEQRDRVYAEEKRRREEAAAIRKEQRMRESQLKKLIKYWQEAETVRMFIAAVESKAGAVDPTTELGQWIEWATKHAAELDPLTDPIEELPHRCRADQPPSGS